MRMILHPLNAVRLLDVGSEDLIEPIKCYKYNLNPLEF